MTTPIQTEIVADSAQGDAFIEDFLRPELNPQRFPFRSEDYKPYENSASFANRMEFQNRRRDAEIRPEEVDGQTLRDILEASEQLLGVIYKIWLKRKQQVSKEKANKRFIVSLRRCGMAHMVFSPAPH